MVPEIIIRQLNAQRFKLCFHGKDRRLALRVSKTVSIRIRSASTFDQRFGGFAIGRHQPVKK
ncbi:hypothetical protein ACNKHW_25750 [Shigella flexneri]